MNTAALFDDARARLTAAGAPREALGELVVPRRILGVARAPRIERRGAAWHLGALLLTDDAVLATGEIVRARQEARRGYTAESQRQRSELAFAARRGGFAEGETVHVGWRALSVDTPDAPLALQDGIPSIRWSAAGALMPLHAYLDERVALLLDPPAGA
ncbi:glutaminase [Microbacterium sp. NEAU-LLC]|uniref:Glutaminase n=1 Tax=Microbacterium helvum TaxID=2773713 RepID=A0ABR8NRE9_9MICO|nr:glutaminase [Microbacterium helvum]MBD3943194.1 glutaminase [Microbacterium helvum]